MTCFHLSTSPTRITKYSGILYTNISDHLLIYNCLGTNKPDEKETFIIKRIITEHTKNNFLEKIAEVPWENILSSKDTTAAFTDLSKIIGNLYNEYFPLRKIKLSYNNRVSWLTYGMKQSIKRKNALYKKMHKHPTDSNIITYKTYRNKLNNLFRLAEKHYQMLLERNKNNSKKTWSIFKEVINKKEKAQLSTVFKVGNMLISDNKKITNTFNHYFVNFG